MQQQPFTFRKVDPRDLELMTDIFRLRFEVYGEECGFIRKEDYPNGLESDEYDTQAIHFAALNNFGEVVGTLRLILPGQRVLPIEKYCPSIRVDNKFLPQLSFAEISRLVISKRIRRRKGDDLFYAPQIEDERVANSAGEVFLRRSKPMAFGLYRELYRESKRIGVTHWYSLMEKSLWLLLRIHGFTFECVGDEVDVFGPVKPYLGKVSVIEQEVAKKFPKFFEYFTEEEKAGHLNKFEL